MSDKPVIEVCRRPMDNNRSAARLAAQHGNWEAGDDPYDAVKRILRRFAAEGSSSGKWDDYIVILLPPGQDF